MTKSDKEKMLKSNVDDAVEREARSMQKVLRRKLTPKEYKSLRPKWVEGARRIERSGKLNEVWNEGKKEEKPGMVKGYFTGVSFDRKGNLIQ